MKYSIQLALVGIATMMVFLATTPLFAGGTESGGGNGGGAWVCRDSNGGIRWAELVDLYEGRKEFDLRIEKYNRTPVEQQIDIIREKIRKGEPTAYALLDDYIQQVKGALKVMPDKQVGIVTLRDSLYRVYPKPEACPDGKVDYEQLANYTSYGTIIVDQEIWEKLSLTDRTALYIHEALYALLRDKKKATDSTEARRLTGYLFSWKHPVHYAGLLNSVLEYPSVSTLDPNTLPLESHEYQTANVAGDWILENPQDSTFTRISRLNERDFLVNDFCAIERGIKNCNPNAVMKVYSWNEDAKGYCLNYEVISLDGLELDDASPRGACRFFFFLEKKNPLTLRTNILGPYRNDRDWSFPRRKIQ